MMVDLASSKEKNQPSNCTAHKHILKLKKKALSKRTENECVNFGFHFCYCIYIQTIIVFAIKFQDNLQIFFHSMMI